ncbi:VOC family protein [Conexibacter stalactiti]|uniref:VOC family protein n=1 Tax=Conexibacter stalactiti TaxID=1940611 RepID=A0ABU4HYH1_9ACTN|nr:VOC family protein [Conexibacter stalactiti]MDW5597515.1 VOC family protein [Conexibacter stalactiti]MEC5038157.1 VOC family protein [Conexibacter stalactiti]
MIALHRIDHVALRVADLDEAARRWALQFGLTERARSGGRVALSCDDEPVALELLAAADDGPGLDHVGWELARGCTLDDAAAHLAAQGVACERGRDDAGGDCLLLADLEGNALQLLPYREPASRLTSFARPAGELPVGHPRKLGHVNFLTARIHDQVAFYRDALGMGMTDWLGDGGAWLHVNADHHGMALVDKGYSHFHHLAFDVVDIGQMRAALDHLGRHGRWLGWGPTRHGVGGNIASYVRIVEEECFVELYCDMEILGHDHVAREWPDDRYSSNTWGPLPPRSYFRFDAAAVASERESLEALGTPLPPLPAPTSLTT